MIRDTYQLPGDELAVCVRKTCRVRENCHAGEHRSLSMRVKDKGELNEDNTLRICI
jgi:hypothetical protein